MNYSELINYILNYLVEIYDSSDEFNLGQKYALVDILEFLSIDVEQIYHLD